MKNTTNIEAIANQMVIVMGNMSDALYGISEGLSILCDTLNTVDEKPALSSLTKEDALSALKAAWLKAHPQHTNEEYQAAILEFEKLVGL